MTKLIFDIFLKQFLSYIVRLVTIMRSYRDLIERRFNVVALECRHVLHCLVIDGNNNVNVCQASQFHCFFYKTFPSLHQADLLFNLILS